MSRASVHPDPEPHDECTDPSRCDCECRACKRAWFDAGRPKPEKTCWCCNGSGRIAHGGGPCMVCDGKKVTTTEPPKKDVPRKLGPNEPTTCFVCPQCGALARSKNADHCWATEGRHAWEERKLVS